MRDAVRFWEWHRGGQIGGLFGSGDCGGRGERGNPGGDCSSGVRGGGAGAAAKAAAATACGGMKRISGCRRRRLEINGSVLKEV